MRCFRILLVVASVSLSGCATSFTLVSPGMVAIEDLQVRADAGWNKAPAARVSSARQGSQTWTRDGMLLDRLVFIPAVADGEAIMVSRNPSAALPVFKADMLPNELEELVESSMVKLFGEGNAVVSTANLRPHRFGDRTGVRFDVDATVTDSPPYRGTVGAFIANERLYVVYFLAATPYYFDKHIEAARAVIDSAMLSKSP